MAPLKIFVRPPFSSVFEVLKIDVGITLLDIR
jgi:hypothetical protein